MMGLFLVYILESAICLSLLYGGYRLLLGRETFHRFNRFALVGLLVWSVVIPLVGTVMSLPEEQLWIPAEIGQPDIEAPHLPAMAVVDMEQPLSGVPMWWIGIVLLVYLAGLFIFA